MHEDIKKDINWTPREKRKTGDSRSSGNETIRKAIGKKQSNH